MVKAPVVLTEDVKELAHDVGAEAVEAVEPRRAGRRVGVHGPAEPRTRATQGEEIELVVDVHRMHFFDVDTGAGIYGGDEAPRATRHHLRRTTRRPNRPATNRREQEGSQATDARRRESWMRYWRAAHLPRC